MSQDGFCAKPVVVLAVVLLKCTHPHSLPARRAVCVSLAAAAADGTSVRRVRADGCLHRTRDCTQDTLVSNCRPISCRSSTTATRPSAASHAYNGHAGTSIKHLLGGICSPCWSKASKGSDARNNCLGGGDLLTATALLLNPCCAAASFSCWLHEHPCSQKHAPSDLQHMAGNADYPVCAEQHSGRACLMLCSQHRAVKVKCWQRGSPMTQRSGPRCSTCRRSALSVHQAQGLTTVSLSTHSLHHEAGRQAARAVPEQQGAAGVGHGGLLLQ